MVAKDVASLLGIFKDDCGNGSAMRVLVFLVIGAVLGNWTYFNVKTGVMSPLPWEQVAMVVGSLFAKSAQKKVECDAAK